MDKCYYYLSNGLWKIAEKYFDATNKVESDFFWSLALHPNHYSFGSHIISTPWQQSWLAMNLLKSTLFNSSIDVNEDNKNETSRNTFAVLRKEVGFQYVLRNYASDPFVQQLFSIYSKILIHLPLNLTEGDDISFNANLKALLLILMKENSSTAHIFLKQLLECKVFSSFCETLLYEVAGNDPLGCLLISALCEADLISFHLPYVTSLLQTPFRQNLCFLLLATDNISALHSMIEEDKKLFKTNSRARLQSLLDNGLEPLVCFKDMITMERHFFLQLLDLVNAHLDELSIMSTSPNIPSVVWPIILLQNWNNSCLSNSTLLQLIEKSKESTKDKTIMQINYILEWYINFCKWYETQEVPGNLKQTGESKMSLLKKAKEHSILYLIINTTDLSQTDWSQIRDLLSRGKPENVNTKSWDLIVFDSYCIMMLVIECIVKSSEIYYLAKLQKVRLENVAIWNTAFSILYYEEITKTLKKVKMMLQSFYPLAFRLEILENIFASIFLTYDDVRNLFCFLNCSVDAEKYLEEAKLRCKVDSLKDVRNEKIQSRPETPLQITKKSEEDETIRKQKLRGFLCKKYIVRDLIYLVKECLEKLEKEPGDHSEADQVFVPCSIKPAQIENRLDRLLESVSEGSWRLQLVTDPDFVSQIGSMLFPCGQDPNHHFEAEWIYLSHDFDRNEFLKIRKRTSDKTNESGLPNNSNLGSENENTPVELQTLKQHRTLASPAIMNKMLACDSSLVVHCLSQGDVLNADHVIQMMSTDESRPSLEGELNFTRAINDLKKKLLNTSFESPVKKVSIDLVTQSRNFQSIPMIGSQSINSTILTNQVERFLAAYMLPSIHSHSKVLAGSVLQCIENTSAIVAIDLALSTSTTFQDFKDLFNIASKHCPELSTRIQSPISAQATFTKPLGYIVFSQNLIALLQEINRSQGNDSSREVSLNQFFRSQYYPFSLKSLKENVNFWKHLSLTFSDFEKNMQESQSLVLRQEGLLVKCQKNIKEIQSIFECVSKLSESCSEFMDLGKSDVSGSEGTKTVNYCDLLSKYLSDLSSFILENVISKDEISEPVTFHNLLEQSAVDIVDKLIFDYNIDPGILEKKAQQLGFNLSASMIAGCCPKLPQMVSLAESSICPPSDRIILNELFADFKSLPSSNPIEVVQNILSELLKALKTYSQNKHGDEDKKESKKNFLNQSDLAELRIDMKIQSILEKTLEVNFIELKLLNESEIRFFFFSLLNLMMCHCYLSTKLEKTDGIYSKYSLLRNVGFSFLGYNIGEIGFMSILDVQEIVLGQRFNPGFSPKTRTNWNWLPIMSDPRLVFLTISFTCDSPPFLLMPFDDYEAEVEEAIINYVNTFVAVEKDTVIINKLLEWYLVNIIMLEDDTNSSSSGNLEFQKNQCLLKFLLSYSRSDLHERLKSLNSSELVIEVADGSREIMLKLDYFNLNGGKKTEEKLNEKWMGRTLSDSILKHFTQNSRILADIIEKIHEAKELNQTEVARDVLTEEKLKYLDILFNSPWLQQASSVFYGNPVIAALSKYPEEKNLISFFEKCLLEKDWNKCLEVIFALPDYFVFSDLNLKRFKDLVLRETAISFVEEGQLNSWYFSEHISDINIRIETVMDCSTRWPGAVCCSQLSSILRDNPFLSSQQRDEIKCLIKKIQICDSILEVIPDLNAKTWFDAYLIISASPKNIVKSLIKNNQLELCLQWLSLPEIMDTVLEFIDADFVLPFFEHLSQNVDLINQLLNSLPSEKLLQIYDEVIFRLTTLSSISKLVSKAIELMPSIRYRLVQISISFLHELDLEEQSHLVHLIASPILIIEQLLMNTKLDALEKILKIARQIDNKDLLDQEEINKLIISYATKAIELNLVKTVKCSEAKQSFLLESANQISQEQVVPSKVPEKSQWVPDHTVTLCMCCRLVSFSMFNRRHHCRRCGKVVCGTCSTNRTKVAGYKDVAVRVCRNCYAHQNNIDKDVSSQSIGTIDSSNFTFQDSQYWKLSMDPSRNATVRDEFSFDYSPDVSLCLALFNLLPDPFELSVLLKQSEKLLKLLQINGKSKNPEIDCGVLIQIIRSLILGAKVKYGQAGLTSGVESCEELLSQVYILQLLINNYCTNLIPSEPLNGVTVRYLRDKLVEEELWDLALEISMKCGLDKTGVWASWGKVCLAAGSWEEARIKFGHCLKSSPKPTSNPPLLDEICRILESPTSYLNIKTAQKFTDKGGVVAQEVAQVLSTLKPISQGKSLTLCAISTKVSVQYEEEVFYLTTYGSHQALLSFYLKHDELKTAFMYLLQQQLEADVFFDCLLLPSYRSDDHEKFKSVMMSIDSSLETFKKYLSHSCAYLHKLGYLHTLYDLQIFMQDNIRAAATSIQLYQKNAVNYTDLVSRSNHLHMALKHLEEELAALGKADKKNKRLDCIMKMDSKTINRHMNTIWRQLEAAKFLKNCESQDKFTAKDLFPEEIVNENNVPTLFDGNLQRAVVVKMIIVLGKNISEGFGIAFRIIQDHRLDLQLICKEIAKKLAEDCRISDIKELIDCLKTSGIADVNSTIDQMLSVAIPILAQNEISPAELEPLCKIIRKVSTRISAFIDARHLIPAYILAAKYNRLNDIEKIMEVAERQGLSIVKKICMNKLNTSKTEERTDDGDSLSSSETG